MAALPVLTVGLTPTTQVSARQRFDKEEDRYRTVERRGGEVVEHALAWLNSHPQGPFFMWVHLYDPHEPYEPPEPYKSRYAAEPYDGEIAYMDSAVGKLLREFKTRGLYDGTMIAVMADHGNHWELTGK